MPITRPRVSKIHRVDIAPFGNGLVTTRLVRATSIPSAAGYVAADSIECRVATQEDLLELVPKGIPVETAGAEAEPAAAQVEAAGLSGG